VPATHGLIRMISAVVGAESRLGVLDHQETQGSPGSVHTAVQGFGGHLRAIAHHREPRGSMGSWIEGAGGELQRLAGLGRAWNQ